MELESLCEHILDEADRSLGCMVIDLDRGMEVTSMHESGAALDSNDVAAVLRSSMALFRNKFADQILRTLPGNHRSANKFVKEAQISTKDTYQFMVRLPGWDDGLIVLITERSANLGLGWMALHQAVESFEFIESAMLDAARQAANPEREEALRPPRSPLAGTGAPKAQSRATPAASPGPPSREAAPGAAAAPSPKTPAAGALPAEPRREEAPASAQRSGDASAGSAPGGGAPDGENADPATLLGPRAMMFKKRQGNDKKHSTRKAL